MSLEVLRAADAAQRGRWLELWRSWPDREVYAHPDYVALFAEPGSEPLCAVFSSPQGEVMYPFLRRDLAHEPWLKGWAGPAACDLTSPYGYGGPFRRGEPDAGAFWLEFGRWARGEGVVSEFVRLSLFADQLIGFHGEVVVQAENVVRDLGAQPEALWRAHPHKVRKNVNKARLHGLRVVVDETGERLTDFYRVYRSTLDRRGADRRYYHPEATLRALLERVPHGCVLFHVLEPGGAVVSSELVLVSDRRLYSFLGGTLGQYFPQAPNDLLKHAVMEWGAARGKQAFVLGGGHRPDDGIFAYKRSLAPRGVCPFTTGRRVHNAALYAELGEARRRFEAAQGRTWAPRHDFFPAYRSPGEEAGPGSGPSGDGATADARPPATLPS